MNRNPKILVVEDDDGLRYAFTRVIKSAGYDLLEATTGQECLELARQQQPDLILMDVVLPDISGVEVCRRLKADTDLTNILVIHISGIQTSADEQADALDAGADGYLTKPIDNRTLLAHVRAMMRIKTAEAALIERYERELRNLESISRPAHTQVTAQMFGIHPLAKSAPEKFAELVESYMTVLDLALEERAYRISHSIPEKLRAIAEQLGFLRAGPRDVIEIHSTALKRKANNGTSRKHQAYLEEGRLLVLEMMGYLVSYYRNLSMGRGITTEPRRPQDRS